MIIILFPSKIPTSFSLTPGNTLNSVVVFSPQVLPTETSESWNKRKYNLTEGTRDFNPYIIFNAQFGPGPRIPS